MVAAVRIGDMAAPRLRQILSILGGDEKTANRQ
jgi:hypothetical protein